ncbi:MAG: 2-hydroxyacyl-CoA dehydratase, partial [Alphaproteobacteria bacterium]|nr:2-hydroxyacyl-CoA dehydratase [Alphaproteobacteria bacterium]
MSMSVNVTSNDLFKPFRDHYHNRDQAARLAHAQGQRLIGRTSPDIPIEPIIAAGFFPLMLTADLARATPFADHYVDPELPGETRILFETIAGGDYEFLDLLILARAQDKLYYFLKEVYRLGRAPKMPALMMYDIMPSLRDSVSAYNRNRYAAYLERLTRLSHGRLTDESLRQA